MVVEREADPAEEGDWGEGGCSGGGGGGSWRRRRRRRQRQIADAPRRVDKAVLFLPAAAAPTVARCCRVVDEDFRSFVVEPPSLDFSPPQ